MSRLTRNALLDWFHAQGSSREDWLVGAEFERHLLDGEGQPLPYFGDRGIRWLLEDLTKDGWAPVYEGQNPIALTREKCSVTLEPGGQFELSGSPFHTVDELAREAGDFTASLASRLDAEDIHQVALGLTPYARIDDIPWVPKGRYVVMREHLHQTGTLAHHMMKGTAAVQASFDFLDEEDCARKVSLATHLGPLTTAIFANSPYEEGKRTGFTSYRGHIWTQTDPARTGLPDAAESFSFARWVDYLLDAPMMFYKIDGQWTHAHGRPFRDWMENGHEGRFPTAEDWDLHLTSVFPEVRIKHAIEVRGADCVATPLAFGFVALFKGLFYCNKALSEATDLGLRFSEHGTSAERFDEACRHGLEGHVGDRRLADWAGELMEITWGALGRCAPEDRPWLRPLQELVESGKSPGSHLVAELGDTPTPAELLPRVSLRPR